MGERRKPLHFAETFEDLEKKAEVKLRSFKNLQECLSRLHALNLNAMKANKLGDQEEEFLYLHRYFMIIDIAKVFKEFKRDKYSEDFLTSSLNFKKYESLRSILKDRYQELEMNRHNSCPNNFSASSPIEEKLKKDLTNNKTAGKICKTSIQSEELYYLITSRNGYKDSYLVIDTRSTKDFKESHLNIDNLINIPEEIITKGMSANILTKLLDPDTRSKWEKREIVNNLIILDWNSSECSISPEAKLFHLKEAMTKWDYFTQYKSRPLILNGGYEDILYKYPHITTNPKVEPPSDFLNNIPSLDFDYPIQVLEPEEKMKPATIFPDNKLELKGDTVAVDRSTKPQMAEELIENKKIECDPPEKTEFPNDEKVPEVTEPLQQVTQQQDQILPQELESKLFSKKDGASSNTEISEDPNQMLNQLRKVKPEIPVNTTKEGSKSIDHPANKIRSNKDVSDKHLGKKSAEGISRIPLKKEDGPSSGGILKRSSSSPNIAQMNDEGSLRMPSFTRANKPVVYAERADSTYGKTAAGLTGLKNFANNCYMNSILQCLSNTKPLVSELISINKQLPINYQSKTKGKIAQEVIAAFRNLWSGDVRVYSIKDLKNFLGSLKDIFKGTAHQDSNEFLIILLEYLHDDLNIPANVENRLDGAQEITGEKAWGEFRRKNCSIIQRLFYGQHRSTVTCSTCDHSSVTFEQFFNLFVPIPSKDHVTLNDCIQLYMSGEKISGWKCPKCRDERNATKKFDISRLPPILVIALKRFTNEEDSWLQKKENLVSYPLEGLDMERFTVTGSEQRHRRYNLYAMSTHTGTLRAGHYKAICKNYVSDKWYMFDDQSVEPLPAHSVRNIPEVYILFYSAELNNC